MLNGISTPLPDHNNPKTPAGIYWLLYLSIPWKSKQNQQFVDSL